MPSGYRDPNAGPDLGENVASSNSVFVACDLCSESRDSFCRDSFCGVHLSIDGNNDLHCHSIDDSRGGSGRRRAADVLHPDSCHHPTDAGHLVEH